MVFLAVDSAALRAVMALELTLTLETSKPVMRQRVVIGETRQGHEPNGMTIQKKFMRK